MKILFDTSRLAAPILSAVLGGGMACAVAEEPAPLPPPSATEVWRPVPPLVTALPGEVPSDATVLFDGRNLDAWEPVNPGSQGWRLDHGAMVVVPDAGNIRTKQAFGDIQLHLEYREPSPAHGSGQLRGNSGVFFMGLYELQIMDSYHNDTYVNGQAGSMYKQHAPLVNACRPPGVWQTYDAAFIAPRFGPGGLLLKPARVTVFHNGVLVQYDVRLNGPTLHQGYPQYIPTPAKLPLQLQEHHGDQVAFRNIWVREIKLPSLP